jgi:membrane-associated protein
MPQLNKRSLLSGDLKPPMQPLLQYILHIDTYLIAFVSQYGAWTYAVLFAIIFCETGLVVAPFLPGDSLLFAAGSIAANSAGTLNYTSLLILLIIASILGNKINYLIGRFLGPHLLWLVNKNHLAETHRFYEKHGGKTIILARFIPIIRTFAPFVAGISIMNLRTFSLYNLLSAILWIGSLLSAGYFFGTIAVVKNNFTLVIYGIIVLSLLPPLCAFIYRKCAVNCR